MTNRTNSNFLVRLLPSLSDVAFLFPVIFVFYGLHGSGRLIEGDTGWHVRTGQWILEHGRIPYADPFSYTKPGQPWFAWEWLWDVISATLHSRWGMEAVVLASLFVACLTYLLVFRLCARVSGNVIVSIAVTWLTAGLGSMHWWARPHMVTFLFLAIVLWIVTLAEEGRRGWLWLLPLLMAVWVNIHGGFLAGIIVLGAWTASYLIQALVSTAPEIRTSSLRSAAQYALVAAVCAAATLLNPYGWRLHAHMFEIISTSGEFFNQTIQEWQSFNFNSTAGLYYVPLLLLGAAAAWTNLLRGRYAVTLLLAAWFWMGLKSARNAPVYALIAAPWITAFLSEQLLALANSRLAGWIRNAAAELVSISEEFGETDRVPRFMLLSFGAWAVLILLTWSPNPPKKLRADYEPHLYPTNAVNYIRHSAVPAPIFTHDEWGDYLIYRLYPDGRVYMDGRFDFYGKEFTNRYSNVMNGKHDWESNLEQFDVQSVLLPVDASLASTLKESRHWRVVYDDGVAIIFERARVTAVSPNMLTASGQSALSGYLVVDKNNK